MPETRRSSDTGAERQLNWIRRYLRKEKNGRAVRRTVFTLMLAALLALGVYAATAGGGFSLPAFAPQTSSGNSSRPVSGTGSGGSASTSGSSLPASSSGTGPVLNTCTVTFDARGGTMSETAVSVAYGACVSEPASPERPGYTFGGWYADVARTLAWDFEKNAVLEDTTLYARWQLTEEPSSLPQTGASADTSLWTAVLGVSLALAALLAYLCRRLERR